MVADALIFVGPGEAAVRQVPVRSPGAGEVTVDTLYSGVSTGTERRVFEGDAPQFRLRRDTSNGSFSRDGLPSWSYPLGYGYSSVGRVRIIGDGVSNLTVGDLVFVPAPHQSMVTVKAIKARRLPDRTIPVAGVLLPNLNTALTALLDARPTFGERAVVVGQGVVGLLCVRLLSLVGLSRLVSVSRRGVHDETAMKFGATDALATDDGEVSAVLRDRLDGLGADFVVEASGSSEGLNQSFRFLDRGGRTVSVSWYPEHLPDVDLSREFHHNRLRLISSQVADINPDLGRTWTVERREQLALDLLARIDLRTLVTTKVALWEAPTLYRELAATRNNHLQCVITYDEEPSS
jgi:2-desacetyl-2-hydroxyethyl bacteriochlorophyllide A dehydrogenase